MNEKRKQPQKIPEYRAAVTGLSSRKNFYSSRILLVAAFVIAIITFLVYLPALNNGFVNWDDGLYVYENREIQSLDFRLFYWIPSVTIWHPITMISLAVDYAIWGLNPLGYHLTNIIIHALNTFLVFILVFRLIEKECLEKKSVGQQSGHRPIIAALVVALLFGIHPLRVESVAWISERKDVLSAFFYLLSLLAYLKYASESFSKKYISYGVCLALFILALMSKPVITLPIILVVLDFYPLQRLTMEQGLWNKRNILIEKIPFFILSLILSFATLWAHHSAEALQTLEQMPILYRALIAVRACIFYIVKMILPLNLAPLYPLPPKMALLSVEYLGSVIIWLIITFICIRYFKRNKLFLAVWVYYVVTLIPVIGIIQVARHSAADRYTYLPSIGLFLLAGLGVARLYERYNKRQVLIASIAVLVLIFGALARMTVRQIAIWHDPLTFWSYEISIFPDSAPVAYLNRADAYANLKSSRDAIKDLNTAIKLDPKYADAYCSRGSIYNNLGNHQQALNDYSQAIELNPKYSDAYYNRGIVHDKLGNYQQAIEDFDKAIKIDPYNIKAYVNRAVLYISLGNYQQAIKDCDKAIELNPQSAKAYHSRGVAYINLGNYRQSIKDFSSAIEIDPKDSFYYNDRGSAYSSLGNYKEAIKDYNTAIELNPQDAYGYYNLGVAYSQLGDPEQAVKNYKRAADLGLKEALDYLRE